MTTETHAPCPTYGGHHFHKSTGYCSCGGCHSLIVTYSKGTTAMSTDTFSRARNTALVHARSRSLSQPTRDYFAAIAKGEPEPDDNFGPFWEALGSCATRAGQSRERRDMVADLTRLRTVIAEHGTVPVPPVTLTLSRPALSLLGALLDSNDDDDELAEYGGATIATVEALRSAVLTALGVTPPQV